MPQANPYHAYEKTNVQTADQRQLILMLYDGAIRFMQRANKMIDAKDVEGAHNYLIRARDIVSELLSTLKPEKGGDIGANLQGLYVYIFNRLVEANLAKDRALVDEAILLMTTLREGWAGIKSAAAPKSDGALRQKVDVRS